MALIDRLIGYDAQGAAVVGHIGGHLFMWTLTERVAGRITDADARAILENDSGAVLVGAEATDAQAILTWVMAPTGTTQLQTRISRFLQVEAILGLGQNRAPGYDTPALVRAKLVAAGALAA